MNEMKIIWISMFCLCFNVINAQEEKTYPSKKDRKNFFDELISLYSSEDVKYIWETDSKEGNFDTWVDGDKESDLIDDFETVIHELFHGICSSTNDGQKYYISKDITIEVPYTEVFNSKELNSFVRKGQQDSIFRYGLYVGGKNQLPTGQKTNLINTNSRNEASSIQDGIYGLMEEFSAYYFSTLTSYPLSGYFKEKFGMEDEDAWYDYRHLVEGTIVAYYEFHFFMGNYLLYAKEKHPDIYKGILNNKPFRIVFTLIEKRFVKLISQYNELYETIPANSATDLVEQMDFSGSDEDLAIFGVMAGIPREQLFSSDNKMIPEYKAALKPEYDNFIKDAKKQFEDDMFFYYASPTKQYKYLNAQITEEMKKELDGLMYENCGDSNYKSFLK